jgi:hypothetical protein
MKPRPEAADNVDKRAIARKRLEQKLKAPLFRVVVNFKRDLSGEEGEETLTLSPGIDELMESINTVINESVDVVCSFARATRAAAVAARAPVPTSARPVPSRPDLRLAEPPKSKVNTRLTGRDRLMPCSQCALTHSDHISQAPAERAEARCPRACAPARAPLN